MKELQTRYVIARMDTEFPVYLAQGWNYVEDILDAFLYKNKDIATSVAKYLNAGCPRNYKRVQVFEHKIKINNNENNN